MKEPPKPVQQPRRVSTDPRFSRRRKSVERTRRRRTIGTITTIGVIAATIWAAFFSPLLRVREVRVVGGHHTTSKEIAAVAGLDENDNLLLLSTARLEADVLTLPWVAEAKVDRRLPDTVSVKIQEREPAIVLEVPTGKWTLDSHGRVLEKGQASPDLPVLSGAIAGGLVPGERVDHTGVIGGLKVWRSLPKKVRSDIVVLFAPSAERISFSFKDHTLVRYGSSRDRADKREVLLALLQRIKERGTRAAYIDIRVPTNPAIAPAPSTSPTPAPVTSPTPTG